MYLQASVSICKCRQVPASACKYLQVTANTCKYLKAPANTCKYLQTPSNTCKYRQVTASTTVHVLTHRHKTDKCDYVAKPYDKQKMFSKDYEYLWRKSYSRMESHKLKDIDKDNQ